MNLLMGIDLGTSGVKVLVINQKGQIKAQHTEEYPLSTPRPNWAQQNPRDWWEATVKALQYVFRQEKIPAEKIAAIGLTGQMHGAVFLDKEKRVISPAILWCDQRTGQQCEQINRLVGKERILEITCNPVLTGFQAPKILWLRENFPDRYRRLRHILLPKDYLRYLLTDRMATDASDASGTSLFDVANRCWSEEILKKLEIPLDFLPAVYESPEISGYVSEKAARLTGLKAGTPVVAGAGDQAAGGVGNGIVQEGLASVTIGTSGVVFAHSTKVIKDPAGRLHTFCHAVPGAWHLMGVMLSAGGALRWFRDTCCQREKILARQRNQDVYNILTRQASSVPIGCEGLLFLPYLTGERCPYADPLARGVFFGLSLKHTHAHLTRAVMEGITFGLKDSLEIMKELKLPLGRVLRASGGGARSAFWCQMQADIFDSQIVRLVTQHGPCLGAAVLAGVGSGIFSDILTACRTLLKEKDRFTPDRKNVNLYSRVYQIYRGLYPGVKPLFERMAIFS